MCATLVLSKNGGKVTETLFLPKRERAREAKLGRKEMYSATGDAVRA